MKNNEIAKDLEGILNLLGANRPFGETAIVGKDENGDTLYSNITQEGLNAYYDLINILYALENIGVIDSAEAIERNLDEIITENGAYVFKPCDNKEKENVEMKNEYKTIINITEANINGDFTGEPYEYVIHTEEPPTEENFNDCYFQAIEIEGISSDCYIDIYTTLNGEFFNHDEGAILKPVKIVYTDVPSKFIIWGNQTPHIFTINREQSKIEIKIEEEITMKDTRETIIAKGLEKAVETWRDSDGDYSAYELIDEFFTALDFPVNYVNREEGEWDILSVAFLTEDNKIDFIKFTF